MGKGDCDIRIGTSGWHYEEWSGLFYPFGLVKNKWFEYYSRHFACFNNDIYAYAVKNTKTLKEQFNIS